MVVGRARGLVVAVALADVVLLLAGLGVLTGVTDGRPVSPGQVAEREWPSRVTAPGPWSATLDGTGDRVEFAAPGTIVSGIARASVDLAAIGGRPSPSTTATSRVSPILVLPDGSRWSPLGPIRLEGLSQVAFGTVTAHGRRITAEAPSLASLIGAAKGALTGVGAFRQPQGGQAERLAPPAGTEVVPQRCLDAAPSGAALCSEQGTSLAVEVTGTPGLTIRAAGNGEVAVAGSARASALGRTWTGLVAAVEAQELVASATFADGEWTVTAQGGKARQVWVDVWPVVDTRLSARSVLKDRGFFDALVDPYPLRIQWTNVGFATSQIFEAEGVGQSAPVVGFDLNKTIGHDAGLGVARGDRVLNLAGGADKPGSRGERRPGPGAHAQHRHHRCPARQLSRRPRAPGATGLTVRWGCLAVPLVLGDLLGVALE